MHHASEENIYLSSVMAIIFYCVYFTKQVFNLVGMKILLLNNNNESGIAPIELQNNGHGLRTCERQVLFCLALLTLSFN